MKISEIKALIKKYKLPDDMNGHDVRVFLQSQGISVENIYQEVEMDSPWVNIHDDTSYSKDSIQLHSHNFYEILLTQSDNVQYLVGNKRYRLQKNDLIIVPPGVSHRPLFLEQLFKPYHRIVLWISQEFWNTATKDWSKVEISFDENRYLLRTTQQKNNILIQVIEDMLNESKNANPGWQSYVNASTVKLIILLSRIQQNNSFIPAFSEQGNLLDEVFLYLNAHLPEKLTLESTASHFHVSQSTISHLFSKRLGESFYQYVIRQRLILAKNYIEAGTLIHNIAEYCGFADHSSFYRLFKKEYGISPQQYKIMIVEASNSNYQAAR